MRLLSSIDKKDYEGLENVSKRTAVRGIILSNNKISLVHSSVYDYYKFLGGGLENNETYIDCLIREIKEETGLIGKKESIKELGYITERHKSICHVDTIFEHYSYYYFIDVFDMNEEQKLDDYEVEEGFELVVTTIDEALKKNKEFLKNNPTCSFIEREIIVLELLEERGM